MPTPAIQAIIQGAPIRVEMKAPQGPGGKSAYQVAVENGFVGTEAQWLASLVGPNTVTSATTTNFTSGNVLFANSGFVGSVSRSGIDTRTSFPNDDVFNATTTGTPSQLLKLNSAGNTVANIFVALEGIEIGEEGGDAGFIRILNADGDVVTLNNANASNAEISLPTESGTLALTTDIVDSVTSATTSDGTANLSISNVTTATATVSSLLTANHIHGNIAGTLYTHVRTGEAVNKGDPVYVSGFHNGTSQPIVSKADASNPAKMPAIGVMDADYLVNVSSANCVIAGTITSVDTDAFSINSPVYVGNGGGFSETIGTIPQQVGIVERSNTNNGAFVVTNNKVVSFADVSDAQTGTAQLSLGDLEVVGGEIYTDGDYSQIYTQGTDAHIFTLGSGAEIFTVGEVATIATQGANATISTAGAGATIGTQGANATIYTQGTNATISTAGSAAHIQTSHASAAVKSTNFAAVESGGASLVDGSFQPCLTWSAGGRNLTIPSGTATTFNTTSYTYGTGAAAAHRTALGLTTLATTTPGTNVANFLEFPTSANLASALTDENGTGGGFVRAEGATLTSPSIAGTASFTGTTRPTSAGTGTPADTSLITSNDAYYRNIVNPLKQGEIPIIPLSQFYAESASAGYMLNTSVQSSLSVYADPSTAQNSWYRYVLSSSIFNQVNNNWSYTRGSELFFLISNLVTSKAGTRHQIAITNTAPEGTIDTASRFGLAIEVFFVSGILNARLLRKLTAASSLETSSSVAFSGTFGALWLRTNADGSIELRVLSSSNFTTLPLRPESASVTLPSGTYTNAAGSLYMTGLATSATIVDNGCYFQVYKAQYHIDS